MPKCWRTVSLFLVHLAASILASQLFENTAIVRTVELGGSVVHVTTTYAIKSLEEGRSPQTYTIALGRYEKAKTSHLEAKIKGQTTSLLIKEHTSSTSEDYHLVDILLPKPLSFNKTLNIVVETVQTHVTIPWPSTASQNEEQALKYTTNLFVLSPYTTSVQRTKIKALAPRVISYTTPKDIERFTKDATVEKSGATVTYGPYHDIPPSALGSFIEEYQQLVTVHYYHEQPVLEVLNLKRSVELSHWGANVNTQDEISLYNAGPKLKGHFSRLDHQTQAYYNRPASHVLPAMTLHLPSGIRNAYYYDVIGNVSTSKLRGAPSVSKNKQGSQFSIFEFKLRYPLLGGWNYSFTLGWDVPLEDLSSYDKVTGRYIVEIPIMTPILGAVINKEELRIILPEGATDVQFAEPFQAISQTIGTHTTYLDTTGRPILTFGFSDLTVKHSESIFVSYKVSWSAHLRKPIAVGATFLGLFVLGMIARRVNLTLNKPKVL